MGHCSGSRSRLCTRGHACHPTALIGTTAASLCALLTMCHLMLCTFIRACLSDICTNRADGLGHFTSPCHVAGGKPADLGTVHVKRNAPGHHLYVLFLQTRSRAVVTSCCTLVACVDTCLKLLLCHHSLLVTSGWYYWRVAVAEELVRRLVPVVGW